MIFSYNVVPEYALPSIYAVLRAERTLWALWPEHGDDCTEEEFCRAMAAPDVLVLAGNIDGDPAGVLTLRPFCSDRTMCGEVGLTAVRKYFPLAAPLCRSALLWCFNNLEINSMVGRVACPNRHILAMLEEVGFSRGVRIPGLMWYERMNRFVDGWLVTATRDSIERSEQHGIWRRKRAERTGSAAGKAADEEPVRRRHGGGAGAAGKGKKEPRADGIYPDAAPEHGRRDDDEQPAGEPDAGTIRLAVCEARNAP